MADHFAALNLPRRASLDGVALQTAYHEACRQAGESVESLNEAYEVLRSPVKRLKHLLECHQQDQWQAVLMSDDLMGLFSRLGPVLQGAQDFSKRSAASRTALSRALLAPEAMRWQEASSALAEELQSLLDTREEGLTELDKAIVANEEDVWSRVHQAQAHLAYLTKWQAQLREALLLLIQ